MMQSSTHAFGLQCDVISIEAVQFIDKSSDFSHFHSPAKETGKQGRMKGLTRAQWIKLNQNNRSVLASRYSVL